MNYRINPKNGDRLSALGFGFMRIPKDAAQAERLVISAIENGVNYFDTAYIYPGNESALGRVLSGGRRERVNLATKLPHFMVRSRRDLDKIFSTQLQRLQTDYIDYYLIHMLPDAQVWKRLCGLGITEWIDAKKKAGEIRNIGFSFHGSRDSFVGLIDAYGWDFCMIQYNYLDEYNQAGRSGLEYAAGKGLPVMIMEPLRGGKLAVGLPREARAVWENAREKLSPAQWGLRWVWNHPEATVVLSGMNTPEMLDENMRAASISEPNSLSDEDFALYEQVKMILRQKIRIPCTGCGYCMPCPAGVDIPACFSAYNAIESEGKLEALKSYIIATCMNAHGSGASLCKGCGKCEEHCPQGIAIRNVLSEVAGALEGFYYKPVRFIVKRAMRLKERA